MDENFLSPYDILGVSENASLGEIHCAYKRLVRTVHPDRNQKIYNWSKEDVNEAFQMIFQAYKTLVKQKKLLLKIFLKQTLIISLRKNIEFLKKKLALTLKNLIKTLILLTKNLKM